uniref:Uncharacterized protein n=1 Tax=Anopheles christyi TaxID=43041 RepID=A0A182KIU0_9DIPT
MLASPTAGKRSSQSTELGTCFRIVTQDCSVSGSILYSWLKLQYTIASSGRPYCCLVVTTMFCGTSSPVAALLFVWVVASPFCTTTPFSEVCTWPEAIIVSIGVVVGSSATLCWISTVLFARTTSRTIFTSVLSTSGERSVALITATLSASELFVLLLTITRSFRCGNIWRWSPMKYVCGIYASFSLYCDSRERGDVTASVTM